MTIVRQRSISLFSSEGVTAMPSISGFFAERLTKKIINTAMGNTINTATNHHVIFLCATMSLYYLLFCIAFICSAYLSPKIVAEGLSKWVTSNMPSNLLQMPLLCTGLPRQAVAVYH